MDIIQAKDIVINAGKELVRRGLIARTWGNVSQKVSENTMVITPSGRDYLSLKRDDIVVVNIDTLEYDGSVKPSSEKGIHAACYKNMDVNFVIHTHQECASAISACNIDGFNVDGKYTYLNGKVICAPYGLPSTKKLCKNVTEVLRETKGSCIIMKNHGALCFGKDYSDTFEAAKQLESACMDYIRQKYTEVTKENEFDDTSLSKFITNRNGVMHYSSEVKKASEDFKGDYELNTAKEVVALSSVNKILKPMVDDFAQIVGIKMHTVKNRAEDIEKALNKADAVLVEGCGAVCRGEDAKAVSMIVEKNCKAFIIASLHGRVKPINALECKLMRVVYKAKYSKHK